MARDQKQAAQSQEQQEPGCDTRLIEAAESDEDIEAAIKTALECPCVKDLKEGPCGPFFTAAFTCFHRSKDVIKGAECFHVNVAFAECVSAHPEVAHSMKGADGSSVPPPELPKESLRVNIGAAIADA